MRLIVRKERPYPGAQLCFTKATGCGWPALTATDAPNVQMELRHCQRARDEELGYPLVEELGEPSAPPATRPAQSAPGALSLLAQGVLDTARRAEIIGLWGAVTALAVVTSPLLGGALTERFGWPAIFLINLPCASSRWSPGSRGSRGRPTRSMRRPTGKHRRSVSSG